ncbi:MAG: hypothetical protein K2O08_02230, partial [Clostridia bacterium]|nr:hypothetical protein [Clostridia bacterium]
MNIRKRKSSGHFVLIALLILCFITASVTYFLTLNKFVLKQANTDRGDSVVLLADELPKLNSPTIQLASAKHYTLAKAEKNPIMYSELSMLPSDSEISAEFEIEKNTLTMNTNTNTTDGTKNSKNAYLDFYTLLVVPAHIEYSVTYTITYSITKVVKSGTANAYAKLYDYGSQEISKDVYVNAENLYTLRGEDLKFTTSKSDVNDYWLSDQYLNTSTGNKTVSKSYTFKETHTNNSKEDKNFIQNFGYYGMITHADSYASSMRATIAVTAEITQKSLKLPAPTGVETAYTGQELTLADIATAQKTWYDSEKMTLTYPDEMKDAGEYQVKVSITNDDDVFAGTPDESNGESETERYFKFKITKKKIGVDISTENGLSVAAKPGAVYSGDTAERAPTLGFSYTSTDGKGYNSDTYPTDIGCYRATVKITNECNYELDDTYTHDFEVGKKEVSKPSLTSNAELTYTGAAQEIALSDMSEDVTITPPAGSGMTYSNGKLMAKDAKTYVVTVSLKDNGEATKWKGTDSIDSYTLTVEIGKAQLSISFDPVGEWSWNSGIEKVVSIMDNRKSDEDNLTYKASLDGTSIDANKIVADGENSKKTNITIPKLTSKTEKYTLSVTLENTEDGKNYTLSGITEKKFSITDKEIEIKEINIVWKYFNDGKEVALESWSSNDTFEVTFNNKDFTFVAELSEIDEEDGVI